MKTKIKRHSRAVISVILTLCMLMSCMTVGIITVNAYSFEDNSYIYFEASKTGWTYNNMYVAMLRNSDGNRYVWKMSQIAGTDIWYVKTSGLNSTWTDGSNICFFNDDSSTWGGSSNNGYEDIKFWATNWSNTYGENMYTNNAYFYRATSSGTNNNSINKDDSKSNSSNPPQLYWSECSSIWRQSQKLTVMTDTDKDGSYTYYDDGSSNGGTASLQARHMNSGADTLSDYGYAGSDKGRNDDSNDAITATVTYKTAVRTSTVKLSATPKAGYEFVDFYNATSNQTMATAAQCTVSGGAYTYEYKALANIEVYARFRNSITTLDTPTNVKINSVDNFEVSEGDATTTQLTWDSVDNANSYTVYKDGEQVAEGLTTCSYTIANTAANSGTYTVKAVTTDVTHYEDSDFSAGATLTVYAPMFSLLGNVDSSYIESITNKAGTNHASTATKGWDQTYQANVAVDGATENPGVYKIKFKTKTTGSTINIGLYQKDVRQRGFEYQDTYYNVPGSDLSVPSGGIGNVHIVDGSGSLILKPGVEYTITIDQRNQTEDNYGTVTITTDSADVNAVARVKYFDPTAGALSSTVNNAPAAVGTASSAPNAGTKPLTTTLTAKVMDTEKYEFKGWFTDADCTTPLAETSASTLSKVVTDINADTSYYALFEEKTPDLVNVTLTFGSNGAFDSSKAVSGVKSITTAGSSYTAYPGATISFGVTPASGYQISGVTATTGVASYNNTSNTVTVSRITGATTINVEFAEVPTYKVTLSVNNSTYGKIGSISYTNAQGQTVTTPSDITSDTDIYVKAGTVVKLNATAKTGGIFDNWSLTSGKYQRKSDTPLSGTQILFMPTDNMTATANFSNPGTATDKVLFRGTSNQVANMTDTGLTVYSKDVSGTTHYYAYIPKDKMNGTSNAYFGLSNDSSYKNMFNHNSGDSSTGSVATGSESKLAAGAQNANGSETGDTNTRYNFSYAALKDTSVSTVVLDMYHTNEDKTFNYVYSVGGSSSGGSEEEIDKNAYQKLYVLDGIVSRNNNAIQDFGTNNFGNSTIISSKSGVLKNNYYDNPGFISDDDGHDEGQTIYYYDPSVNLDFRVQTVIADNHQAIGIRAFVMNGRTYPATKTTVEGKTAYYADITLDSNAEVNTAHNNKNNGTLEVIPVYYNTLIPEKDYIKFYVDANSIGETWGKTIGYSLWYSNSSLHGMEGGYPGQPLMSDGSLLYGYFPKYYVGVDAAALPEANDRVKFAGVLLSNLAEHNYTHHDVLNDWLNTTVDPNDINYQSFDYEDPVEIAKIANVDTIMFVTKYKELTNTHRSDYGARNLNGTTGKSWPTNVTKPTGSGTALETSAKAAGFEYLTDIDGNRVNIFNEKTELSGNPLYVISVGNQQISPNDWDTVWEVYDSTSGTSIAAARPVDFINPSSDFRTTLASYTNRPVFINYEGWLKGESNSGTRLDGRWLFSKSTDPTTLRLRVATETEGTLTFQNDFLDWAEISNGSDTGIKEYTESTKLYNHKLSLPNRTTEVVAKINPVRYKVRGMYMLGAAYSSTADNGFSSSLADYDDLNVSGTMTSFINAKDNRMVIVVDEIPETDLYITHQMYGGPGAHKIKGFYWVKAELYQSNKTTPVNISSGDNVDKYGNFYNTPINLSRFTTDAPKGNGYKLKVTIKTEMSGSATFFQWYENNQDGGYDEISSTDARGSSDPVETVIWVDVDSLYGDQYLAQRNLDYYSDLQSSESININHLLTSDTVSAKLDGTTYTKVTVVDSSGNAVRGGSYDIKAKTTVVDSSFITSDAADAGNQIKVEIWTVPKLPAAFDSFYRTDTVKLVDGAFGGIAYTSKGETITYNSKEYPKATVMIPISYFFKSSTDDQGNPIEIFDSAKKDFNVYSALKQFGKYTIEFNYTSRLYDDQTYVVKGDITEDLMKYFDFTNKKLVEDNKQELIDIMAPKEDNFMKTITWSKANISYFDYLDGEFTIRIEASQVNAVTLNCKFNLPYAHTFGNDKLTIPDNTKDSAGRPYYVPQADNDFSAKYMNHYTLDNSGTSNQFITAAPEIYDTDNKKVKYFQYWNVYRVGGPYEDENVIRKCYFNAFNLTFYEAYRIEAVYGNNKPASPSSVSYNDGIKASISWLDNSRNQWNAGHGGSAATVEKKDYWDYRGDRVFSDFALSFSYNDLKLKESSNSNIKTYFVIEQLGKLNEKNDGTGELDTQNLNISPDDDGKDAVQNSIQGTAQPGKRYIKKEIAKSDLDNKNCIEYYYNFANRKQEDIIDPDGKILLSDYTKMREYLYRAYAVIYDGTTAVASDPAYFTIYDIASIENYQQKNYSQD